MKSLEELLEEARSEREQEFKRNVSTSDRAFNMVDAASVNSVFETLGITSIDPVRFDTSEKIDGVERDILGEERKNSSLVKDAQSDDNRLGVFDEYAEASESGQALIAISGKSITSLRELANNKEEKEKDPLDKEANREDIASAISTTMSQFLKELGIQRNQDLVNPRNERNLGELFPKETRIEERESLLKERTNSIENNSIERIGGKELIRETNINTISAPSISEYSHAKEITGPEVHNQVEELIPIKSHTEAIETNPVISSPSIVNNTSPIIRNEFTETSINKGGTNYESVVNNTTPSINTSHIEGSRETHLNERTESLRQEANNYITNGFNEAPQIIPYLSEPMSSEPDSFFGSPSILFNESPSIKENIGENYDRIVAGGISPTGYYSSRLKNSGSSILSIETPQIQKKSANEIRTLDKGAIQMQNVINEEKEQAQPIINNQIKEVPEVSPHQQIPQPVEPKKEEVPLNLKGIEGLLRQILITLKSPLMIADTKINYS